MIKQKLSSRKLWALIADLVICVLVLFGVDSEIQLQMTALIAAVGGVVAYVFAEACVDKAWAGYEEAEALDLDGLEIEAVGSLSDLTLAELKALAIDIYKLDQGQIDAMKDKAEVVAAIDAADA